MTAAEVRPGVLKLSAQDLRKELQALEVRLVKGLQRLDPQATAFAREWQESRQEPFALLRQAIQLLAQLATKDEDLHVDSLEEMDFHLPPRPAPSPRKSLGSRPVEVAEEEQGDQGPGSAQPEQRLDRSKITIREEPPGEQADRFSEARDRNVSTRRGRWQRPAWSPTADHADESEGDALTVDLQGEDEEQSQDFSVPTPTIGRTSSIVMHCPTDPFQAAKYLKGVENVVKDRIAEVRRYPGEDTEAGLRLTMIQLGELLGKLDLMERSLADNKERHALSLQLLAAHATLEAAETLYQKGKPDPLADIPNNEGSRTTGRWVEQARKSAEKNKAKKRHSSSSSSGSDKSNEAARRRQQGDLQRKEAAIRRMQQYEDQQQKRLEAALLDVRRTSGRDPRPSLSRTGAAAKSPPRKRSPSPAQSSGSDTDPSFVVRQRLRAELNKKAKEAFLARDAQRTATMQNDGLRLDGGDRPIIVTFPKGVFRGHRQDDPPRANPLAEHYRAKDLLRAVPKFNGSVEDFPAWLAAANLYIEAEGGVSATKLEELRQKLTPDVQKLVRHIRSTNPLALDQMIEILSQEFGRRNVVIRAQRHKIRKLVQPEFKYAALREFVMVIKDALNCLRSYNVDVGDDLDLLDTIIARLPTPWRCAFYDRFNADKEKNLV
ncbi:MAG: hypothetical protein NHG36_19500, partial [Chromatiaceae bacterium]|nr:hypothetical protein [Candidatus Thioaporhodococcus sediminis]